jgi:large subunit ribosomal protein L24
VFPDESRATVQGLNLVRRHTRQTAAQESGIYTKEAPIHLSNLALVDAAGKPTRIGFKTQDDGKKVRVARTTGDVIDG